MSATPPTEGPSEQPSATIGGATAHLPGLPHLARLLVLTDRRQSEAAGRRLIDTVAEAVDGGARTVVLREKDLPRSERFLLALSLTDLLLAAGATLVVASDVKTALAVGSVAVHLAADDPVPDTGGWHPEMVWGRSCHGPDEVARAAGDGAGYVTLSPIFPSASKPGYGPPLGCEALRDARVEPTRAELARAEPGRRGPALVALGGVSPGNAAACRRAGADGVAVMGGVMASPDPAAATAAYLAALDAAGDAEDAAASDAGGAAGRGPS